MALRREAADSPVDFVHAGLSSAVRVSIHLTRRRRLEWLPSGCQKIFLVPFSRPPGLANEISALPQNKSK
jgi:hypothetical protein